MNVILITLDTTRADYLSCYGFADQSTPNLDALAKQGTLFELAHSTSALTPVSHASILTGLNQYQHGLRVLAALSGFRLARTVPTLATDFKQAGYETAAIHSAFSVSAFFGLDQSFDTFQSFDARVRVEYPEDDSADATGGGRASWNMQKHQRRSDETTDLALEYLKQAGEPFFLWVHYWDPHDSFLLPPPEYKQFQRGLAGLSRSDEHKAIYRAEISYQDEQIGRLLDHLRQTGLMEQTLLVVTADHGEGLAEHGWESHRILYEEQIHVPLIIRDPKGPKGLRVTQLVGLVDIAPTLLDYAGIEPEKGRNFDGISLRPLIEGRDQAPRSFYADQINGYDMNAKMVQMRPQADFLYSVTRDPWKLIYRPGHFEQSELYNLRADREEATNLWSTETDVRRELLQDLARINSWCTQRFPEAAGVDSADREAAGRALESLGYLGGEDEDVQSEPKWAWTCIDHAQVLAGKRGRCPESGCDLLLLLRSRPK